MDSSAIKEIRDGANLAEILALITENTKLPAALVPPGYTVQDMEDFNPTANFFKLKYTTPNIADFIEYCSLKQQDGAMCFVDGPAMKAKTIFDLGTAERPLHKHHSATLDLQQTVAYKALLAIDGQGVRQTTLAEFIEDWSHCVTVYDSADIEMGNKIAALRVRDVTIDTTQSSGSRMGNYDRELTEMEKIEAKNKDTLPAYFDFKTVPFHTLPERTFRVRLAIITGQNPATFKPRIVAIEQHREQMADELKAKVTDGLANTQIKAFIGSI